ncbi:outer-membrane lipoprotein carrier protein precursor [mine drainage metagenome]|uniref:Outer-membrane lipoprotein carrier protein n=1 Tax=mine drainage metagenome TaxID=410659 RepID=A0A1J5SI30_9ZZZZ
MFALGKIVRRAGLAALLGAGLLTPAWALGAGDKAELAKAEAYLNAIHTMRAHFVQINPSGDSLDGAFSLWRPGRLRLDYNPPSPVQVIADGDSLIYYDKQLKQVSYLDLDSSIAGVLVRDKVNLDGPDLKLMGISHSPDLLKITVTQRNDPSQGQITLIFTEHPFALRQWKVIDAQGQETMVSLYDPEVGVALDKSLFTFVNPAMGKGPITHLHMK